MRIAATVALLLCASGAARAETLVRLERPEPYSLQFAGVELDAETEVRIEALGLREQRRGAWLSRWWGTRGEEEMEVYAWVLDSAGRRPVWRLTPTDSSHESATLRRAETKLRLGPGRYEVYLFSGYRGLERRDRSPGDESWWERWFGDDRRVDDMRRDLERCHVTLTAQRAGRGFRAFEVTGDLPGALLRHNRVGDSRLVADGFELSRPGRVRVYSVFERGAEDRHPADYGWIVDAATREVAWSAARARSRPAGGGEKNRVVDEEVELDAGRYLLYFGTDDSHSLDGFNANPPHDPLNWGITLLPGAGLPAAALARRAPETPAAPLVEFVRVGDGQFREQPFRLARDATLWIRALGEYDAGDDAFFDYGWIADAASGRTVWEMTGANTRGAGGASKNVAFDGLVELPRGDYVLYYVTDGSHAHDSWNGATPFEPEAWGISLRPAADLLPADFRLLDAADLPRPRDSLVRLVRVGDHQRLRERFELERPTRVRVYALGEGSSGEMYDYGLLRNVDTGRVVWEMRHDRTRHAGGAGKNRLVEEELSLEAGSYEAEYVSDGSHSFAGWNAAPPRDRVNWGLTVYRLDR